MSYSDRGNRAPPGNPPILQAQVLDERPVQYNFRDNTLRTAPSSTSAPSPSFINILAHYTDVGIIRDTLLPSLVLNSSLSTIAWATGRYFDRLEAKDWLWPSGQVLNAWWSAVGRRVIVDGTPISRVFNTISWPEGLLLTGVTLWGARLFYRIASRSLARGEDDARYIAQKEAYDGDRGQFWNSVLLTKFLPEALFQAVISLPFTAPFRHQGGAMTGYHPGVQATAVGLFSAGFALEVLADAQLEGHKKSGGEGVLREGVWSIVRHPNYLGDILVHISLPLLLYGSDMLRPIELLGPLANYIFLRYIGGDKENEESQMERYEKEDPEKRKQLAFYRATKNAVWPNVQEFGNRWLWVVVGCGAAGVVVEQGLRRLLH